MLSNKGFDLWADNYDKYVGISDEERKYPFNGYKKALNGIYNRSCGKAEGKDDTNYTNARFFIPAGW